MGTGRPLDLSIQDAWYVAVAEAFGLPLATLDARLRQASGAKCRFQEADLFAVEQDRDGKPTLREPDMLGDLAPRRCRGICLPSHGAGPSWIARRSRSRAWSGWQAR